MQTTGTVCGELRPIEDVEVDHRVSLVGVALAAGLDAGVAADAAARIDEELLGLGDGHASVLAPSARRRHRPSEGARRRPCTRGSSRSDPARRSSTGWRSCAPGQWYGMKIVSGRIVRTTRTARVQDPRRDPAVAQSPSASAEPRRRLRMDLDVGLGALVQRGPMRRVCSPDRNWLTTRPVVRISGYSSSGTSAGGVYGATTKCARPSGK